MKKPILYTVFYLQGGWENMVCSSLNPLYTESEANKQIAELNKAGYPAMKLLEMEVKTGKYFISSFECSNEAEMKKYYQSAIAIGFPYGNPFKK